MCLVSGVGRPAAAASGRKRTFELVVGEPEGVLVEDVPEGPDAGSPAVVVEGLAQRVGVDHVQLVRLVDRALEASRPSDGGEVEEGPDGRGDGDAQTIGRRHGRRVGRR